MATFYVVEDYTFEQSNGHSYTKDLKEAVGLYRKACEDLDKGWRGYVRLVDLEVNYMADAEALEDNITDQLESLRSGDERIMLLHEVDMPVTVEYTLSIECDDQADVDEIIRDIERIGRDRECYHFILQKQG